MAAPIGLQVGPADCSSGLSLRILTALTTAIPPHPSLGANLQAVNSLKVLSHAIAAAVIAEIQANANVGATTIIASGVACTGWGTIS